MNVAVAILIVVASTVVAIAAMLWVRRTAPDGSYFHDGDRAAGVFGVLATGFAVLLGFVVFLAFTSYDAARAGAESEAQIVAQQVETAQLFPPRGRGRADRRAGLLRPFGRRRAVGPDGGRDARRAAQPVGRRSCSETLQDASIRRPRPSRRPTASGSTSVSDARKRASDRIHGAVGVIPTPLWLVLFFISALIFVYMLFFADSGERAVVQAMLMGTVVAVVVSTLLLLQFLNNPFHEGVGGLRPVAMERTLKVIDQELNATDSLAHLPCDHRGLAL